MSPSGRPSNLCILGPNLGTVAGRSSVTPASRWMTCGRSAFAAQDISNLRHACHDQITTADSALSKRDADIRFRRSARLNARASAELSSLT
jgi:hypothetical protein